MPTYRLEMSSSDDSDDSSDVPKVVNVVVISSDSESDDSDSDPSFVVSDSESAEDDLSFAGAESSSSSDTSSNDTDNITDESDVSESEVCEDSSSSDSEQWTSGEDTDLFMIMCHLCGREYTNDNFSAKRQKMHALGVCSRKIFCLLHTSTSDFGADHTKSGVVTQINNWGRQTGSQERNIFLRPRTRWTCG